MYISKVRIFLSLHSKAIFDVFQRKAYLSLTWSTDDAATLNVVERKWQQANQNLWSILFFTTSDSADNVVKEFEGK